MLNYILWFIIFSFAGWILDTAYRSLERRAYVSETYLPFLATIYGFGALGLIALYKNTNLSFVGDVFVGGICITAIRFTCLSSLYIAISWRLAIHWLIGWL